MGDVVSLNHARIFSSSNRAKRSSVTPEIPSSSALATTLDQRYEGIESRHRIVRAWLSGIPIASPNSFGPPKASMMDANEFMTSSLHQVATRVNTASSDFTATIRGMTPGNLRKRQGAVLRQARILAGYKSAREAALENRWPESTYRAHEGGTRTIGQDDAERYIRIFRAQARDLKITSQSVLYPDTAQPSNEAEDAAYRRGWEDAMAHVLRTMAAPPPSPGPESAPRSRTRRT